MMRSLLLLITLLSSLLLPLAATAETASASVDRQQLGANETLNLTLRTDQRLDTDAVDFTTLRQDFDILSLSPQSRLQIINGRTIALTQWQLVLMPKRSGTLQIPAFNIGQTQTDPIAIEVSETVSPSADQTLPAESPLLAELEVSRDTIHVNEQLLITVRLLAGDNVSNLKGEPLKLENSELVELGQRQFQRRQGSHHVQVVELTFAAFANAAGTLTIPPLRFTATAGGDGFSNFGGFGFRSGKTVAARTQEKTVRVLPPATDARHLQWLPASGLKATASWHGNPQQARVGEPLTRTIALQASGQRAAAIPPLPPQQGDFKAYPDQPKLSDDTGSGQLVGTRIESLAIVPTQPGHLILPAIRVSWWDTQSQQWRETVIAEETLQVAPAETAPAPVTAPPAPQQAIDGGSATTPAPLQSKGSAGYWPWACALLLVLLLLSLADNWRLRRRPVTPAAAKPATPAADPKALQQAIRSQDAHATRQALLHWASDRVQQPLHSLQQLAAHLPTAQGEALKQLDQAIYGNGKTPDWGTLRDITTTLKGPGTKGDRRMALPALYHD